MILKEIKHILEKYKPRSKARLNLNLKRKEFGGLKASEVLNILKVTAKVQAIEETHVCLSNQGFKDSSYRDLIENAIELDFSDSQIAALENHNSHLPFFIPSLGPHLPSVIYAYLSASYFKKKARTSERDRDMFFSFYRASTGLGLGISEFSALSDIDGITEIFKVALAFPDACNTTMPQHLSFPKLGLKTENSPVASQGNIAACAALALSPLFRSDEMPYAEDSIVNFMTGDSATNEPSVINGQKMIRRHMYLIAKHFAGKDEFERAHTDETVMKKLFEKLKDKGVLLRFAMHVFDNRIGISCASEDSQSWSDPLHDFIWTEKLGMSSIVRFNSLDFLDMIQKSVQLFDAARKGPVFSHVNVPRPAGHSISNFYGLSMIPEKSKSSPIPSLTLEEAIYHNNNDSMLNAFKVMIDLGFITSDTVVNSIVDSQRSVIERYIALLPEVKTRQSKRELVNVMPYYPEMAQYNWEAMVLKKKERDRYWKNGHLLRLSKTPGLRFPMKNGMELPEDLDIITPIQAENFSLSDILLMSKTFRAIGQDIPDIRPGHIDAALENPGSGTGGINKATAGLQVLSHLKNPKTGRYHILDIGIDEPGLYAMAAGTSHALDGKGFVLAEIQFNDYDFGVFAPDEFSTIYQRSNGNVILPVVIRQSFGFVRGRTIDSIMTLGGAGGCYHSSCSVGSIANRLKGVIIVVPNTAQAIQTAYRNAASGCTPTYIFLSNPVMRNMAIGSFNYSGTYLSLDTPLDPVGTYYTHSASGDPIGAHHHIILTFGEYVPICHMVAEQLLGKGIKVIVVDYNYVAPRNKNVIDDLLNEYRGSSIRPEFTVVSQEGDFGFGDVLIGDLAQHKIFSEKIGSKNRRNQWIRESLTFPKPSQIFNHILQVHRDQVSDRDGFIFEEIPRELEPMEQYFTGMSG